MPVEIVVALIGLGGVLVGGTTQWWVARSTIRAEAERLHGQLSGEFKLQQFSEWQTRFQSLMGDLLAETDPESKGGCFAKERIVPLVLQAQLMLNPTVPSHAKVNQLINQLALSVCGWHGSPDLRTILTVHSALLEAAKDTLYLPGK